MTRLLMVAALLALAGCTTFGDVKRDAKCQSFGAKPGTEAYVNCRAQLEAARRARFCQPAGNGVMCF